nr:Ribonuclease H1, N-terminal [Ipomoea batatas]
MDRRGRGPFRGRGGRTSSGYSEGPSTGANRTPLGNSANNSRTQSPNPSPAKSPKTESKDKEVIQHDLVLNERLKYIDFSGTEKEFKCPEGSKLSQEEKILIDNVWVSTISKSRAHTIASLNGLCFLFTQKRKEQKKQQMDKPTEGVYVLFHGPEAGIYKDWADVVKRRNYPKTHYKKYNSFPEAHMAISKVHKDFFIDPAYQLEVVCSPETARIKELEEEIVEFAGLVTSQEEEISQLKDEVANLNEQIAEADARGEESRFQHILDKMDLALNQMYGLKKDTEDLLDGQRRIDGYFQEEVHMTEKAEAENFAATVLVGQPPEENPSVALETDL